MDTLRTLVITLAAISNVYLPGTVTAQEGDEFSVQVEPWNPEHLTEADLQLVEVQAPVDCGAATEEKCLASKDCFWSTKHPAACVDSGGIDCQRGTAKNCSELYRPQRCAWLPKQKSCKVTPFEAVRQTRGTD